VFAQLVHAKHHFDIHHSTNKLFVLLPVLRDVSAVRRLALAASLPLPPTELCTSIVTASSRHN
jgi:hypothetical protein